MTPDAGAQPGELSPADGSGPRELLRYRSAQGRWVVVADCDAAAASWEAVFDLVKGISCDPLRASGFDSSG